MNFFFNIKKILARYGMKYVQGTLITLFLSLISVLLGSFLGLFISLARMSKRKWISRIASVYIELLRGTPMSSEATAVSTLVREWLPNVSIAWLGSGIILAVTLLNLLGASKLSKLESVLAGFKILAVLSFLLVSLLLIFGLFPGKAAVGLGALSREPLLPNGLTGLAGSMLVVMFTYAGFEIIGFTASETGNPQRTIPKAIQYTVISLVGLYVVFMFLLLPLVPTDQISENSSPIVMALQTNGLTWVGSAMHRFDGMCCWEIWAD